MHHRLAERRNKVLDDRATKMREQIEQAILSLELAERHLLRAGADAGWSTGQDFLLRLVELRHKMRAWLDHRLPSEVGEALLHYCEHLASDMREEVLRRVN